MQFLKQLTIILAVCFIGEIIRPFLPITLPSSVIAMILLLLLLLSRAVKEHHVADVGDFFLKNMGFFFIPSAVGILEYFDVIKATLIPFFLICLITFLLTFAATAYTVIGVQKLQQHLMHGGKNHD